ncbi:thiamine phosphate synthase [Flavobacterium sp.]|uniref:thiamine phosphate synthase n=1 Tax=Flavobacterium sp. TaxID=239 RepID=UPI003C57895B
MIVISNPTAIANEINTIHALFEQGLALFHVRKPDFSATEMKAFVLAIGLEHSPKLVLHSHHQLAAALGINRLHFTTKDRATNPVRVLNPNWVISTSTHSIQEFNNINNCFEYAFLSPVYPSISKTNYQPDTNLFEVVKNRSNFQTKLIGLGGMEAQNIAEAIVNGFDDVALLGTIWNSETPIENFKLCQQIAPSF